MRHKLTAITTHPNTGFLPKCGNQDFKVEHHNDTDSFFAGSQHEKPYKIEHHNKGINQLFADLEAYINREPTHTIEDDAAKYRALADLQFLKEKMEMDFLRINTIFNRA